MSALHFIGKLDKQEEAFLLSAQQEQTMARTLFKDRDEALYQKMYGYKRVRDVYDPPTRGASGKNVVLPFYDR